MTLPDGVVLCSHHTSSLAFVCHGAVVQLKDASWRWKKKQKHPDLRKSMELASSIFVFNRKTITNWKLEMKQM